jgi:hypothetical protein
VYPTRSNSSPRYPKRSGSECPLRQPAYRGPGSNPLSPPSNAPSQRASAFSFVPGVAGSTTSPGCTTSHRKLPAAGRCQAEPFFQRPGLAVVPALRTHRGKRAQCGVSHRHCDLADGCRPPLSATLHGRRHRGPGSSSHTTGKNTNDHGAPPRIRNLPAHAPILLVGSSLGKGFHQPRTFLIPA